MWNYKLKKCIYTLTGHLDYIRTVYFHHEVCDTFFKSPLSCDLAPVGLKFLRRPNHPHLELPIPLSDFDPHRAFSLCDVRPVPPIQGSHRFMLLGPNPPSLGLLEPPQKVHLNLSEEAERDLQCERCRAEVRFGRA